MNHVSVSPTDGNGPTQGRRKTLTRVGIEPTTFGLDLPVDDFSHVDDFCQMANIWIGGYSYLKTIKAH